MYDLSGFRVLITGASSGFGLNMSRALMHYGAKVAMASRPGEKLQTALALMRSEGYEPLGLSMDVRSEDSVADAADELARHWGTLDMLVNNAGIGMGKVGIDFAKSPKSFYEIKPSAFRDIVETNFIGYFLVARAFTPMMVNRGKGRIVNISTSIPTMTAKDQLPYGPARAAAEAMSVIMTEELRNSGITVNVLLPGGAADTGLMPEELREEFLKRFDVLPADILNDAVCFLASPLAEGMTGERIIAKEFQSWLDGKGVNM